MNRWGDPRFRPVQLPDRYAEAATGPVAYLPVARGDETLGYLWASDVDGAAGWVERGAAGPAGWNAGTPWLRRLSAAKAAGRAPGEALRELAELPDDPRAGRAAAAPVRALGSLAELIELAGPVGLPATPVEPAAPPRTGSPPAGLNTVQQAAYDYTRAPDVHNGLLQDGDPPALLARLLADPARAADLAGIFGSPPRYGDFVERYRLLDQAVSAPLPESLETLRGVEHIRHVAGGVADVRALAGSTHTEPGYLSVSLGATPAYHTGCWLRLVAPKGTRSLWMGRQSHHPNERELILPRGLTIRIDDVYLRDDRVQLAATIVSAAT
ncbi:ADP-ribosyltransferase [Phytohabitans kaempferiae]|uniref:ADP-ribosyltransferase n=1 Tax=Phytohabitans kaempferiae TaxID=1620943 RepID=A0ABV6M8M4_9ACTN